MCGEMARRLRRHKPALTLMGHSLWRSGDSSAGPTDGGPMTVLRAALTDKDVRTLVKGDTDDERASAAHKLCRTMDREALTDDERRAAQ